MEENVIKELFVMLTREPLTGKRREDQEVLQRKNNAEQCGWEDIQKLKSKRIKRLHLNNILCGNNCLESVDANDNNFSKQVSFNKRTTFTELTNIYKRHNMPYKECVVILEKLDVNAFKGPQSEMYRKDLVVNVIALSNTIDTEQTCPTSDMEQLKESDKGINPMMKHLVSEKLPVYNQIMADRSKENSDLYEFDEPDSDNFNVDPKVKRKLNRKKKVKNSNQMSLVNKKKRRGRRKVYNTYDAAVHEILQKVMEKVNHGKLESVPIQDVPIREVPIQEVPIREVLIEEVTPHEYSNHEILLQDNISDVEDIGECNNSDVDMEENQENEPICEHSAQNNNSKDYCFCSPLKANKRIHVISDITLDSTDNSFLNQDLQPNANSTVLVNQKCNPWRFTANLKRNPHYLNIKKTALPSLQQDMVIDYTQVRKIEERHAKIPKKFGNCGNKATPIEESGLFCDTTNKENIPHKSLLDGGNIIVDQLKLLSTNKQKRNILGPRLQTAENIIKTTDVPIINTVETPTSIDQDFTKLPDIEKLDENLDTSRSSLKEPVNNDFDGKLFEDEEPVIKFSENISKIYIPKVRKRKKLYGNIAESNQEKHKKEMTKKEEAELEQWAAKFNAMFKDVENYQLEIE